jgi:hypothetical protein
MPAVTKEKHGEESRILVLGDGLAILIEEGVAAGLDVLLVLDVILCPVISFDLAETSVLPIGEQLVNQTVTTHNTRRYSLNRLGGSIRLHHPMQVLAEELNGLAILIDLISLGDGPLCCRFESPHEAKILI